MGIRFLSRESSSFVPSIVDHSGMDVDDERLVVVDVADVRGSAVAGGVVPVVWRSGLDVPKGTVNPLTAVNPL